MRERGGAGGRLLQPLRGSTTAGRVEWVRAPGCPRPVCEHDAANRVDPMLHPGGGLDRFDSGAGFAPLPAGPDGAVPRLPGAVPVCGLADERAGAEMGTGPGFFALRPPARPDQRGTAGDGRLHDGESLARRSLLAAAVRGTGAEVGGGELSGWRTARSRAGNTAADTSPSPGAITAHCRFSRNSRVLMRHGFREGGMMSID